MHYINFQTVQLDIFGEYVSGMIGDPYSDVSWNPAFILTQSQSSAYIDINFNNTGTTSPYYINPMYNDSYTILPGWYGASIINPLNTEPIYRIALFKKISPKLSLGIINRSLIDYEPFRSSTWWDQRGWEFGGVDYSNSTDLNPETLHIDKNNQHVFGNQSEFFLGYQLFSSFHIGFKFGHYIFRRKGSLYDSKCGDHPHYTYANLNDESLNIDGDQYESGVGLMYYVNKNTVLGIYGSYMSGSTTDTRIFKDTLDTWSERAEDVKYYSMHKYNLFRDEHYSSDDSQPLLSLIFEKKLSSGITFRSFLKANWLNSDISGKVNSNDTTYSDRTYDTYYDYFQRREYHDKSYFNLQGTGETRSNTLQWFSSIIYAPEEKWSIFSGIYFSRTVLDKEISEDSNYISHDFTELTQYKPGTIENSYRHEKQYSYILHSESWRCIFPIGFRTTIVKGFDIIMGAHICFTGYDSKEKGSLLYPGIHQKKWEDDQLIIDDIEEDRYELYHSHPSFTLDRETDIHFGAMYEHTSGLRVFFRTEGNFSDTDFWTLGFEMIF